jgi:hypothetical protein
MRYSQEFPAKKMGRMQRFREIMSVTDDYMELRALQKRAREEMWHVLSHHPEMKKEWDSGGGWLSGGCYKDIKRLLEWEPED